MARTSRKAAKASSRRGKKEKAAKPKAERKAKGTSLEVVDEKPGPPVETVLLVITGLALIAAMVFLQLEAGKHYGVGMFKDMYVG